MKRKLETHPIELSLMAIGTVTLRILHWFWSIFCYIWGKLANILGWQRLKLKIGRLIWKNDNYDN